MEACDFDADGDEDIVPGSFVYCVNELAKLVTKGLESFPQLVVLWNDKKSPPTVKSVGEVGMTGQLSNLLSQAAPDEAHQNKKPTNANALVGEVGTTGFEPATPCTPCKCATGLRYVPKKQK